MLKFVFGILAATMLVYVAFIVYLFVAMRKTSATFDLKSGTLRQPFVTIVDRV